MKLTNGGIFMSQLSNYILNERIYKSEKTVVHRGIRIKDKCDVLIKQLNEEHPNLTHIFRMKHEFEVNQIINSNLIVKIYEIDQNNNLPILIIEDFGGESLHELLKEKNIHLQSTNF